MPEGSGNHTLGQGGKESIPSGRNADKLKTLPDLLELASKLKSQGQTIVYCHGTFDLLHLGHLRHFIAAREEGDVLIVGVTADQHVIKGPGRPYFNHALRAEMIAGMACVDYVCVVDFASSVESLTMIKPDVYVKGSDYVNPEDDVTGKILQEKETVERFGGRMVFTNDITFSSSSLLNQYFDLVDPLARELLKNLREIGARQQLFEAFDRIKDYKVVLLGDTIIDEYRYTSPLGKSPKENIIVTQFRERERFAGGVVAAANHLAGLCREVQIVTCHGEADNFIELARASLKPNVQLWSVPRPNLPTTRKCRYLERGYMRKLFEVYFMDDSPLAGQEEQLLIQQLKSFAADADLVIVTDFGHGLVTPPVIQALNDMPNFLAVNAQTNSANVGFNLITRYPSADFVCIDAPEARLAIADKNVSIAEIAESLLPKRMDCKNIIVTAGLNGCYTYNETQGVSHIPALTKTVVDTMGAGDAFFVVAAPLVRAGLPTFLAGLVGNIAGAIKVGILGHQRSVEKATILRYLETLLK